jgi:uncharacterized protein (DUF1697 family)
MTRAVALLRAVNVGGTGKLPMADLAKLLTKLGYTAVKTILQSGNAVFTCDGPADAKREATLEAAIAKAFGLQTAIVVRSAADRTQTRRRRDGPQLEHRSENPRRPELVEGPPPSSLTAAVARLRSG